MCNILYLKRGMMPNRDEFDNMCYNNWHSYGLVVRVGDKLDITRKVPESGEIDPEEIWNLLRKDVEYDRILHVRHNTAGATNLENCHPFEVYYNEKSGKHIVFMHNGTLYPYKSKKYNDMGTVVDDDDGPSDSLNFVTQVLTPLIAGSNFGTGRGDIHNEFFKKIVEEFWMTNNRGVLIANDQAPYFIGDWKTYRGEDNAEIKSANTEYFKSVIRGPELARREAARKKAAANSTFQTVANANSSTAMSPIAPLNMFEFGRKHPFYQLKDSAVHILSDWNVYDRVGAVQLGMMTYDELEEIYGNKRDCVNLMDWVFTDYYRLWEEFNDIEDRHKKATSKVSELVEELKYWKGKYGQMDKDQGKEKEAA